jgi:hypothetical protein
MQLHAHNWAEQNGHIIDALYDLVQARVAENAGEEFVYLQPWRVPETEALRQANGAVNAARVRYYQTLLDDVVREHVRVAGYVRAAELKERRERA